MSIKLICQLFAVVFLLLWSKKVEVFLFFFFSHERAKGTGTRKATGRPRSSKASAPVGRKSGENTIWEKGAGLGICWWICCIPWAATECPAQATLSTEFIVLGFLGQGFYLAWDLWHLLLMNVYS